MNGLYLKFVKDNLTLITLQVVKSFILFSRGRLKKHLVDKLQIEVISSRIFTLRY